MRALRLRPRLSNPNPDWRVTRSRPAISRSTAWSVDMTFRATFGWPLCNVAGVSTTITGTLGGGQWTGNGANQHEVIYNDDEGFAMHTSGGTVPVTTRGTFRDTQQTLTLT